MLPKILEKLDQHIFDILSIVRLARAILRFLYIYLSTVKAVMVRTVALAEVSAAKLWIIQNASPKT